MKGIKARIAVCEMASRLEQVCERLHQYGLRVNVPKSTFLQPSVSYCGHWIDEEGLHKSDEKIEAV